MKGYYEHMPSGWMIGLDGQLWVSCQTGELIEGSSEESDSDAPVRDEPFSKSIPMSSFGLIALTVVPLAV
ncbi:MAG: hypothetical protein R3300_00350 [Candidatus Promineifilaceae bacterium]|nr:hypothetical protein [Candidatus Promineifilaceae bacterium]